MSTNNKIYAILFCTLTLLMVLPNEVIAEVTPIYYWRAWPVDGLPPVNEHGFPDWKYNEFNPWTKLLKNPDPQAPVDFTLKAHEVLYLAMPNQYQGDRWYKDVTLRILTQATAANLPAGGAYGYNHNNVRVGDFYGIQIPWTTSPALGMMTLNWRIPIQPDWEWIRITNNSENEVKLSVLIFAHECREIPEPATLSLVGLGIAGLILRKYRQRT